MNLIRSLPRNVILTKVPQYSHYVKKCKHRRPDISHPALWYEDYPVSLIGKRQSPINIETEKCVLNHTQIELPPIVLHYPPMFYGLKIKNPKDNMYFGWRVDIPYDFGDKTILTGGLLNHRYKLIQFHAHWGKDCFCGSEHTINGKHYSAELHFVHWNSDLYPTARQAAISKDGLAVVAVFLESVDDDQLDRNNNTLSSICDMMSSIKYKNSIQKINTPLNLLELIPEKRTHWTYLGSLTTPPLWETVTWIIFEDPVKCTKSQLEQFRNISYYAKEDVCHLEHLFETNVLENYRPAQPLNSRPIIYVNKAKNLVNRQ